MMFSEVPDIEITNIESKSSSGKENVMGTDEIDRRIESILDKSDYLRVSPAVDDDFHAAEVEIEEALDTIKPQDRLMISSDYTEPSCLQSWAVMCLGEQTIEQNEILVSKLGQKN